MKLSRKLILTSKILSAKINNYFSVPDSLIEQIIKHANIFLESGKKYDRHMVYIPTHIKQWKYLQLFKKNKQRDILPVDYYLSSDIPKGRSFNVDVNQIQHGIELQLTYNVDLNSLAIQHEIQHILRYNILPKILKRNYGITDLTKQNGLLEYFMSYSDFVEQVGTCINVFKIIYKHVEWKDNLNKFFNNFILDKSKVKTKVPNDVYIRYQRSMMFLETLKQFQPAKYKKAIKQIYEDLDYEYR